MIKKKILITGVAGFIGFSLAEKLLRKNKKVYGIDNNQRNISGTPRVAQGPPRAQRFFLSVFDFHSYS